MKKNAFGRSAPTLIAIFVLVFFIGCVSTPDPNLAQALLSKDPGVAGKAIKKLERLNFEQCKDLISVLLIEGSSIEPGTARNKAIAILDRKAKEAGADSTKFNATMSSWLLDGSRSSSLAVGWAVSATQVASLEVIDSLLRIVQDPSTLNDPTYGPPVYEAVALILLDRNYADRTASALAKGLEFEKSFDTRLAALGAYTYPSPYVLAHREEIAQNLVQRYKTTTLVIEKQFLGPMISSLDPEAWKALQANRG